MFNFQNLIAMASQAMMKKLVSSDAMYQQWQAFSRKWGLPETSRAFDFLDDKDAPEGKAKRYYVAMHCAE